ncbi:MAG: dihydrodipicolinate synthase family protein [Acidobacteria bacterium]|nr:dihydrodipicolinate synthase family protein [Acidobacteriota bacterium]
MKEKGKLKGVIVPAAVPLRGDDSPDLEAYADLIRRLVAEGVDGIFANGSMGGFAFHTDANQQAIVEMAVETVAGRCPVLAGISDTSLTRVLQKARAWPRAGIDAFVVMPPYYFIYAQPDLERYFLRMADALERPLVLYENPRLARNSIAPATIALLAKHPNIIGVKHSHDDVPTWQSLLAEPLPRERFALICGAEKNMSTALRLGFDGITGGFHNVVPDLATALYAAAQRGDFQAADAIQSRINAAYAAFEIAGGFRGLDVFFRLSGIGAKASPAPFGPPTPADWQRIEAILTAVDAAADTPRSLS